MFCCLRFCLTRNVVGDVQNKAGLIYNRQPTNQGAQMNQGNPLANHEMLDKINIIQDNVLKLTQNPQVSCMVLFTMYNKYLNRLVWYLSYSQLSVPNDPIHPTRKVFFFQRDGGAPQIVFFSSFEKNSSTCTIWNVLLVHTLTMIKFHISSFYLDSFVPNDLYLPMGNYSTELAYLVLNLVIELVRMCIFICVCMI